MKVYFGFNQSKFSSSPDCVRISNKLDCMPPNTRKVIHVDVISYTELSKIEFALSQAGLMVDSDISDSEFYVPTNPVHPYAELS